MFECILSVGKGNKYACKHQKNHSPLFRLQCGEIFKFIVCFVWGRCVHISVSISQLLILLYLYSTAELFIWILEVYGNLLFIYKSKCVCCFL